MAMRSVVCGGLPAALALALAVPGLADTIVPVGQDRFTSVVLQTDCKGQTSDGDAAQEFEPFASSVEITQNCPEIPVFAVAAANQNSSIGGTSMTAFGNAWYFAQSPGSVFVSAVSNFSVTFELPRASRFELVGSLLGDGLVPGMEAQLELSALEGPTLFSYSLSGPFPPGEPAQQGVSEDLALDPGVFTLHAQALAGNAVDIGDPPLGAESALNLTVNVSVLGDVNGDEAVDVVDFLALLAAWGPCDDCTADVDGDGTVGINDLLALLGNWTA